MQKFLLLRNNKQTGPYSVEELEQMGLKPYDLIWVNGKSAAWRYPGEIDELKSFAPAVEEQPYDRFYKKPTDEPKKAEPAKAEAAPVTSSAPSNGNGVGNANGNGNSNGSNGISYTPATTPSSPKKSKEYKRVFVTMPNSPLSNKSITVEQPQQNEVQPFAQPKAVEPVPSVNEKQKPQKIEAYVDQNNGHSSIDIYYTRNKSIYSRKSFLVSAFAIGILALIALGMFIGLSLRTPNRDAGKQETEKVYRVSEKESKSEPEINRNTTLGDVDHPASMPPAPIIDSATILANAKKARQRPSSIKLKDLQQKSAMKPLDSNVLSITPEKPEPEKRVPEKKAPDLSKLVSVSNNDFQVGPFGGISKLELTVHNSSDYPLDLVIVELEYLKVNKDVFKTETLYFKDVEANSSVTVGAPKSSRGNKINYKISLISAKDRLFHASSDK